ncbi:MAG TPA: hypothetical protein DEO71_06495 [Chryseobacterium sp.]|nr:hypothetical protein [Chryseobacterium sp.]
MFDFVVLLYLTGVLSFTLHINRFWLKPAPIESDTILYGIMDLYYIYLMLSYIRYKINESDSLSYWYVAPVKFALESLGDYFNSIKKSIRNF